MGRTKFRRGDDEEIFSLPVYLRMIEDYYSHCGSDIERLSWVAITHPEPPIDDWGLEGESLWYIARVCMNAVEDR